MRSTYVMTRFTVPLENFKNESVFEVFHEMDPDPALQKPRVRNSGFQVARQRSTSGRTRFAVPLENEKCLRFRGFSFFVRISGF